MFKFIINPELSKEAFRVTYESIKHHYGDVDIRIIENKELNIDGININTIKELIDVMWDDDLVIYLTDSSFVNKNFMWNIERSFRLGYTTPKYFYRNLYEKIPSYQVDKKFIYGRGGSYMLFDCCVFDMRSIRRMNDFYFREAGLHSINNNTLNIIFNFDIDIAPVELCVGCHKEFEYYTLHQNLIEHSLKFKDTSIQIFNTIKPYDTCSIESLLGISTEGYTFITNKIASTLSQKFVDSVNNNNEKRLKVYDAIR